MMSGAQTKIRSSFDTLVDRLLDSRLSLEEEELLRDSHWSLGQDARLREDVRFRQTTWRRWIRAEDLLANDALHRELHSQRRSSAHLNDSLDALSGLFGRRCVFCPGDPRFVIVGDQVRLAASELSKQPVIEDEIGDLEKYTTHLPIHSLKAAAASEPAGEWGPSAQEQMIETLGWVRVSGRQRLNSRMFVAQIEGHSMDDGRSGLVDGGYAIFELWPSGTKQLLSVLVRGSFNDPETGSYAVKKYVADQRDEEGRHHEILLVSLNPDKDRYPDIELRAEDDEALTVVAKVIQPLSPDDYARRPKPLNRKGRRNLADEDALEKIHRRLSEHAADFFDKEPLPPKVDEKPDPGTWNSQLVCLEADAGGVHLELGPLFGLWKFVKVLVARSPGGTSRYTLASNARLRPVRVSVMPSEGPWTWGASGFEDDPDVDLSSLDVPALPSDRVSAFRVATDGIGRLSSGTHLSLGQAYRLLVPPEAWKHTDCPFATTVLDDGWHLAELTLPSEPTDELVEGLEKLGFLVGNVEPALSFGLASWPDEWRSNRRGEGFATFSAGDDGTASVFVTIEGYDGEVDDEARLFVQGPEGPQSCPLPAGTSTTVELSDLTVGQYFCTLLHQHTLVEPAHLPFEVSSHLSAPPRAAWSATVAGNTLRGTPGTATRWSGDLALLHHDDLVVEGPPGWHVRVLWREVVDDYLATMELDQDGRLDIPLLLGSTSERRNQRLLGDLVLDLAEIGSLVLVHERKATTQSVGAKLGELVAQKGDLVRRRAGNYLELLPMWFEPMGHSLGYEVGALEGISDDPPPIHAAVARLMVTERRSEEIMRRCKRVLVMLEDLRREVDEPLFSWIDRQCNLHQVERAIVTDGLGWAEHRRRSRLPLKIWRLQEILGNQEAFIEFLRDVAEGV